MASPQKKWSPKQKAASYGDVDPAWRESCREIPVQFTNRVLDHHLCSRPKAQLHKMDDSLRSWLQSLGEQMSTHSWGVPTENYSMWTHKRDFFLNRTEKMSHTWSFSVALKSTFVKRNVITGTAETTVVKNMTSQMFNWPRELQVFPITAGEQNIFDRNGEGGEGGW